jgi:hypothetical protein
MNPNWTRWILASIAVYFKTALDTINLPLLCDGIDERELEKMHYNHAELRVSGPFIKELSKDYWEIRVDINILLIYFMQSDENNIYDLQSWCGIIQSAMNGPINIYKYGGEVGDGGTRIGCLRILQGRNEANRVMHFGQVSRVDRIRESMIDGRFIMELET